MQIPTVPAPGMVVHFFMNEETQKPMFLVQELSKSYGYAYKIEDTKSGPIVVHETQPIEVNKLVRNQQMKHVKVGIERKNRRLSDVSSLFDLHKPNNLQSLQHDWVSAVLNRLDRHSEMEFEDKAVENINNLFLKKRVGMIDRIKNIIK